MMRKVCGKQMFKVVFDREQVPFFLYCHSNHKNIYKLFQSFLRRKHFNNFQLTIFVTWVLLEHLSLLKQHLLRTNFKTLFLTIFMLLLYRNEEFSWRILTDARQHMN